MSKTKQQKFTDSLRQTQTNTFSDGLNMDLHPLSTPNTVLTDCINGTMITYNDNEFVLQNERGNTEITGAELSKGFIPVAMKEYNGILYIVSYNPKDKKTEIGTFPSPKHTSGHDTNLFVDNIIDKGTVSNYTDYKKDIVFYDYKLSVSNYDKYNISVFDNNPLLVLDHYILDKQGNTTKLKLNHIPNSKDEKVYRFTHVGEGVLGYLYRPYFLSSRTASIIPTVGATSAKLVITTTSDDEALLYNKQWTDFTFTHDIRITLLSEDGSKLPIDFKDLKVDNVTEDSLSISINNWEHTYNIVSVDPVELPFKQEFFIKVSENESMHYKYDFRDGVIVLMENDSPTSIKYNKVQFDISTKMTGIKNKELYTIYMDHLTDSVVADVSSIFSPDSWFSKFQYYLSETPGVTKDDEIYVDFNIIFNLDKYDINYLDYKDVDISDATYKLHEIDENGNLKGLDVSSTFTTSSFKFHNVVTDQSKMGFRDLFLNIDNNRTIDYKFNDKITPIQVGVQQCANMTSEDTPVYVKYVKKDGKYNIELFDANLEHLSTTDISHTLTGGACGNNMEEYFLEDGTVQYLVQNVKVRKNKIYLFELTFDIRNISENKWKRERASFIVVTSDYMLNLTASRKDEVLLSEWFGRNYKIESVNINAPTYYTSQFFNYKNNIIDLSQIDNKTVEEVKLYAKKFFLKYNPLFENLDDNLIPSITQSITSKFTFKNTSNFNCALDLSNYHSVKIVNSLDDAVIDYIYDKKFSLTGTPKEYKQTVERKYLWDLFKNDFNLPSIQVSRAGKIFYGATIGSCIGLDSPKGYYCTKSLHGDVNWIHAHEVYSTMKEIYYVYSGCNSRQRGEAEVKNLYEDVGSIGASLNQMYKIGMSGGMYHSSIKQGNYVKYKNDIDNIDTKLWIHGKTNAYVLVGIDLWNTELDSKLAYDAILKHAYYLNPINKTIYQYTYDTEDIKNDAGEIIGSQVQIKELTPEISNIIGKIYPLQCLFINNDYADYNIQSYNNLNYNYLNNINEEVFIGDKSIVFEDLNDNYSVFLRELGDCLNRFYIPEEVLTQYNGASLYFDYDKSAFDDNGLSYYLFNQNIEEDGETVFFDQFSDITNPYLKYDKNENILYTTQIKEDQINQFEYTGGDCVAPLKWNYSLEFDEFWKNADITDIDKLNKYHSLLFYRYSSYADE